MCHCGYIWKSSQASLVSSPSPPSLMVHTTRKPVQSVHSSIYSTNPTGCHWEVLGDKDGVWSISGPRVQGRTTPRRTWTSPIFPPGPLTILPLPVWTTFNRLPRPLVRLDQQGSWQGLEKGRTIKSGYWFPQLPLCKVVWVWLCLPAKGPDFWSPAFSPWLPPTTSSIWSFLLPPPFVPGERNTITDPRYYPEKKESESVSRSVMSNSLWPHRV